MSLEVMVDCVTPGEWQTLASAFADHNIYQTWEFGTCRAAEMKAEVSRLVVRNGDKVLGMAQARIKRLPLVRAGVTHILRGPLWRRQGSSPSNLQAVLQAIRSEYAVRRGLVVRVIPNLPAFLGDKDVLAAFDSTGFVHDPDAGIYRTFLLDLSPSLAELRRGLAQKWRNCLNQSEKRSLTIEAGTDDIAMAKFERLYSEMWSRKRFETGVSVRSFCALQRALPHAERQLVLLASLNGEPVAGHVSSTLGDTCIYLLGASNETGRRHKASYLLQWRTIERAKEAGALWYDLGGIDPDENPGTYHFKAGVGGQDCRFVGQFCVWRTRSSKYLIPLAERAYGALRPLRRAPDVTAATL